MIDIGGNPDIRVDALTTHNPPDSSPRSPDSSSPEPTRFQPKQDAKGVADHKRRLYRRGRPTRIQ
jgi:hypothetical protein